MVIPIDVRAGPGFARLVLEPWGTVYELREGETRTVLYTGAKRPALTVSLEGTDLKLWCEGDGVLEVADPA